MPTTTEKTVREIAIENPASIRVFESFGIDYCCGGKRSLSDACASAGVEMGRVIDRLQNPGAGDAAEQSVDWKTRPLGELIAHIVGKHHSFVRSETLRITTLLGKVTSKHGPAHPEVVEIEQLFGAIGQELAAHMMKEEQILFPYVARMEQAVADGLPAPQAMFGTVTRPIAMMIAEHEDAGALLAKIRQLSGGFTAPAGACPTFLGLYKGLEDFEGDLHRHIHLENNILFPRAVEMEAGR